MKKEKERIIEKVFCGDSMCTKAPLPPPPPPLCPILTQQRVYFTMEWKTTQIYRDIVFVCVCVRDSEPVMSYHMTT